MMPIKLMDRRADETAVLVAAREGSAEALGQLYAAHADEICRVTLMRMRRGTRSRSARVICLDETSNISFQ